ncbi:MAG: hypothetical protein WHT82_06740 [Limisphaera sp.]
MRGWFAFGPVVLLLAGCGGGGPSPAPQIWVHWHYAGSAPVRASEQGAQTKRLLAMPESQALLQQTLDKLARAPRRWGMDPELAAAHLRPLLSQLIQAEHVFQWQPRTGQASEWVLAVHLDSRAQGLWRTNLQTLFQRWTGQPATVDPATGSLRWAVPKSAGGGVILLAQVQDWCLISGGAGDPVLSGEWIRAIQARHRPVPVATSYWARLRVDWPALKDRLPAWLRELDPPMTDLLVTGSGDQLQLRAELKFPRPHGWTPEPWLFPSNLIREPLVGFCAARGIRSRVEPWLNRAGLHLSPTPGQFCAWSLGSAPFQVFVAVPVPDATNAMRELCRVLPPWFNTNSQGRALGWWIVPTNRPAILWDGMPFFGAFCRPAHEESSQGFLFAGLFPNSARLQSPPPDLFAQILGRTNLVYYDWELGGERVRSWRIISQVALLLAERQQLAETTPGARWLEVLTTNVGNVGTSIVAAGPDRMVFTRTAPLGLTGWESVLLAHWLEAPGFPWSFDWPPERRARPRTARSSGS